MIRKFDTFIDRKVAATSKIPTNEFVLFEHKAIVSLSHARRPCLGEQSIQWAFSEDTDAETYTFKITASTRSHLWCVLLRCNFCGGLFTLQEARFHNIF